MGASDPAEKAQKSEADQLLRLNVAWRVESPRAAVIIGTVRLRCR